MVIQGLLSHLETFLQQGNSNLIDFDVLIQLVDVIRQLLDRLLARQVNQRMCLLLTVLLDLLHLLFDLLLSLGPAFIKLLKWPGLLRLFSGLNCGSLGLTLIDGRFNA